MRVGPSVNAARVNVAENITALWTFADALGLLTDDINERTASAGVTIDNALIRDGIFEALGRALASTNILVGGVSGDSQRRFDLAADGGMEWGSGSVGRDTTLFRAAANLLATDDDLRVAGAAGVVTDDITERTAAAGVTIDGALIRDNSFRALLLALGTDLVFRTNVTGDTFDRFIVQADGRLRWGPGGAGGDTVLYRAAANELATDDDLNVGGTLDLAGEIEFARRNANLVAGANADVDTGTVVIQRFTPTSAGSDVSGFAGGTDGRFIIIRNTHASTVNITLQHQNAGSAVANRIITPNQADFILTRGESAILYYDGIESRWAVIQAGI